MQESDPNRSLNPLRLIKILNLLEITKGNPAIKIGIIDGPVDASHPSLSQMRIIRVKNKMGHCNAHDSIACIHGTFIAGILGAKRGYAAPALCPSCSFIVRPVFMEGVFKSRFDMPSTTPIELADAIVETIDDGARVINLSLGLASSSLTRYRILEDAYIYARKKEVLLVISSGNQGNIGYIPLLNDRGIIPVTSCDENGKFDGTSNFGPTIGTRGLMAPGVNIISSIPDGRYAQMSGTSVAAAFVTGTLALLLSVFPKASVSEVSNSLFSENRRRAIIPRLLNVELATKFLRDKTYESKNLYAR